MKSVKYTALFILLLFMPVLSQDRLPREYVPPEELCSINGQLEFQDALNILSEYSISFANKPIFDPTKQQGAIGIDINAMQWEKALQMMLSSRGLWYEDKDHFFEIVYPSKASSGGSGSLDNSGGVNIHPGSREIKIETIFFQGDRKAISEIGIDWSTFYNGKVNISGDQLGALSVNESFLDVSVVIPNKTYDVDVRALLSVFDTKNIGKVLAQPQVVVTEGNQGKIQVGQDFSIKTRDFAGNVIDRFFSTGTILEVTPYLVKDAKRGFAIVLKAHVERSNATPDVVSTIINKSEANSNIQLYDGEETIIAGLYNTEKSTLRKGLPFIKDLPVWFFGLSYLFGYNREEFTQKELIIILKASVLPDVYDRKDLPVDQSFWGDPDEIEKRLHQFKRKPAEPVFPQQEMRTVYNAPKAQSGTYQTNRLVQQPRSASVIEQKPAVSESRNSNYYSDNRNLDSFSSEQRSNSYTSNQTTTTASQPQTRQLVSSEKPALPVFKPASPATLTTTDTRNYYLGEVEKVDEEIVLIKWQQDFNTDILNGNRFSVIRVNSDNKPQNVGLVLIQSTKYERSIGKKLDGQVRPGDMIVVKFNSNA